MKSTIAVVLLSVVSCFAQETNTTPAPKPNPASTPATATTPESKSRNQEKFKELIAQFPNKEDYTLEYDKFKDKTDVHAPYFRLKAWTPTLKSLHVKSAFVFPTDTMKEDETYFTLFFYSTGNKWSFISDSNLYVIADGKRLSLGKGDHDGEIELDRTLRSARDVSLWENVSFLVPREIYEQIANAEKVEIKLGNIETELTPEAKQAFKNILNLGLLPK
jgi:hypothetical protein